MVKLKLDTTSIIQNDYKLKLLKILETQDKNTSQRNKTTIVRQ